MVGLAGVDELGVGPREVDDLARLVPDHPCVMPRRDDCRDSRAHLEFGPVLHDHMQPPGHDEQLVQGPTEICADDGLDVGRPFPPRLHHLTSDRRVADRCDGELRVSDAVRVGWRVEPLRFEPHVPNDASSACRPTPCRRENTG